MIISFKVLLKYKTAQFWCSPMTNQLERRYTRSAFISFLLLGLLSLLVEVVYVLFNYVLYVMGSYREMPIIRRQIRQEAMAAAAVKELQAPSKDNNSKGNFQKQQQQQQNSQKLC
ncbi:hypothetical protein TYRP_001438 [Tyrophagus putrescentiae]|nr:hypothetical protein TYRP_001438 [Tyrophagus putrescentiae]